MSFGPPRDSLIGAVLWDAMIGYDDPSTRQARFDEAMRQTESSIAAQWIERRLAALSRWPFREE